MTQIWPVNDMPVRFPTAKDLAKELLEALQNQPLCAGLWIPALCIQDVIYPKLCSELGWPPRSWMGKNGVAAHFAKQLPFPPKYIRQEIDGEVRNLQHYFIPRPETAKVIPLPTTARAPRYL